MSREQYGQVSDIRIEALNSHLETIATVKRVTGLKQTVLGAIRGAFLSGYDRAMEHAGKNELLEENRQLQTQFLELDMASKHVIALNEFMDEASAELGTHELDCKCRLCSALARFFERRDELERTGA